MNNSTKINSAFQAIIAALVCLTMLEVAVISRSIPVVWIIVAGMLVLTQMTRMIKALTALVRLFVKNDPKLTLSIIHHKIYVF